MPSGVIGDPTRANAQLGKVLFEECVERLGPVFAEIARFTYPPG
jgi:creatinine amidohydrolase/Fe(II)-dependent formamide hydrolase-like protein